MFFEKKYLESAWSILPHSSLLNYSEDNLFTSDWSTKEKPIFVELPYPLHKPLPASKKDKLLFLVNNKLKYNQRIELAKKQYKKLGFTTKTRKVSGINCTRIPRGILLAYESPDPDKYFDCDYNVYATGGVLEKILLDNEEGLVRPDVCNNLLFNKLEDLDKVVVLPNKAKTNIYELKTVQSSNENLLIVREKQNVQILDVKENFNAKWTKKFKIPILDAKLNSYNITRFAASLSSHNVHVMNIETNQSILKHRNRKKINPKEVFQRLHFHDENTLVLLNRKSVRIFDTRNAEVVKTFEPSLNPCNTFCNFDLFDRELIVVSRHYVVKCDIRKLKSFQYFPHNLKAPPCYSSQYFTQSNNYFVLAAQKATEKTLFSGDTVFSLPHPIPSLQSTFKETQLTKRVYLNPTPKTRLNYSTSGIKLLETNSELQLFSCNSLGELFVQKISELPIDSKATSKIDDWAQSLRQKTPKLNLKNATDVTKAFAALNQPTWTLPLPEGNKKKVFLNKYEKPYAPIAMQDLAKSFLQLWLNEEEQGELEPKMEIVDHVLIPQVEVIDKVNDWIKGQDFDDDLPEL